MLYMYFSVTNHVVFFKIFNINIYPTDVKSVAYGASTVSLLTQAVRTK
jgi:hypothetical protein